MELTGRTALITGGARRLGRQIALALAHAGANVVVNYRQASSEADAASILALARGLGVRAAAVRADVSDAAEVERLLDTVAADFPRIDVFVANAGAFRRTPLASLGEKDWQEMLRFNLDVFRVPAQRIGLRMKEQGGGCIVALADVAALRPWADYIPYSVAKAGVVTVVQTLAVALAPQVRVNAVAPGPILFPADADEAAYRREIERTLLQRSGTAEDVADAVLFLARNDYVTGVVLPVDGGRLLRG